VSNAATHVQQPWIYKAGGNKKQPARACKLGTTLAFFDPHLQIQQQQAAAPLLNAQSFKILTGKGAATCQHRSVDCTGCFVAEMPDT